MKMKNDVGMTISGIWQPYPQQQLFRRLLHAFSYPGRIEESVLRTEPVWLAILGALVDGEVTLADPQQLLSAETWPKLEARRAAPETADFILLDGGAEPSVFPNLGTLDVPEGGATLLLRVGALHSDEAGQLRLHLNGPGIKQQVCIGVDGLHPAWIDARNDWVSGFPLGVEMVLCDAQRYVALPRTTHIRSGIETGATA
jgi:alpha-D-ribose 1-methylphosphonate 5-triphosphate synthase subunit PhnH